MNLLNRLNKRIKIYKASEQTNSLNEVFGDPILVAEVWGAIEPLQGKEFFLAGENQSEVTTRIRIRYRKDIDRTMWVTYGDDEYEIKYIIHPKSAKVELQLMCRERQ